MRNICCPLVLATLFSTSALAQEPTSQPTSQPATPPAEADLTPVMSLEGAEFGPLGVPSHDSLLEVLGEPEEVERADHVEEATGCTLVDHHWPSQGVHATLCEVEDVLGVRWVVFSAPWEGEMPGGLHIGMAEADAATVLGQEFIEGSATLHDYEAWRFLGARSEDGVVVEVSFGEMGE